MQDLKKVIEVLESLQDIINLKIKISENEVEALRESIRIIEDNYNLK